MQFSNYGSSSGLMTGRPGVNHPDVIKSRVSSPKANGKLPAILV